MSVPRVLGLNHVTLAVSDLGRATAFYRDVLGCVLRAEWPEGVYLEAGPVWLCLSVDPKVRTEPHPDYTHVAFDVDDATFEALEPLVRAQAKLWKENRSAGRSLYFLDPDGHKLELHVGSLATRLKAYRDRAAPDMIFY
ncbi:MAG TPA: VOC family protein [Brevundimonas sp.]|jgi:catechol 2,3-dioxygenase-like lactoylglutathione lyase family enzyme